MVLDARLNGKVALAALALLLCAAPVVLAGDGDERTTPFIERPLLQQAGPGTCGDGIVDTDAGETCERPGDIVGPADQACRDDCTFCGDAVVQAGEECDDGNGRDADGCRNSCVLPVCGDGLASHGIDETCDPPGQPFGGNGNDCRDDCTACGDGTTNGGEECDDANGIDTDGCRNNCLVRTCGDGILDSDLDEECDDANSIDDDGCRNNCTIPRCGDGVVDPQNGETCEAPGDIVGPADQPCRDECTYCGDGVVQAGEDCDDGDARDTNSCPNSCSLATCGDGNLDTGESCDPPGSAAGASGNACRDDCTVCGDGNVDAGEGCDDGNNVDGDGCNNDCTEPRCGDGTVDSGHGETCDPPGIPAGASGNPCRSDCTVCGDGNVDPSEECDDANSATGDGCAPDCTIEDAVCDIRVVKTCSVPGDGDDDDDDDDGPMDGDDDDDDDDAHAAYLSGSDCSGDILSMKLRYTGEGCAATTNNQSGLAGCWGDASDADHVAIQVANVSGSRVFADEQEVFLGDVVEVQPRDTGTRSLSTQTTIWIDYGMENVILNTSCDTPLTVGDQFGSMQVIELTTTDGGTLTLPPDPDANEETSECTIDGPGEVVYTYTITNNSPVAVENLTVVDSELGEAPGSPFDSLASYETLVLHASALITETTTNTVTVGGVLETGEVCPAFEDTATVTVAPAVQECSSKIAAMLLEYIGPDIAGPVSVEVLPKTMDAPVTYDLPDGLPGGTVLSSPEQNGFTFDPASFGVGDAGAKTTVFINGVGEEHHTSCSTPYVAGLPAPLNQPTGEPSPLWRVVDFTQKSDLLLQSRVVDVIQN